MELELGNELDMLKNSGLKDGSMNALDSIKEEMKTLEAKKHLFSIIHAAEILDEQLKANDIKDGDIQSLWLKERETHDNRRFLDLTIQGADGISRKTSQGLAKTEVEVNDFFMHTLKEPNYKLVSQPLVSAIFQERSLFLDPKLDKIKDSFIDNCLCVKLLSTHKIMSLHNELDTSKNATSNRKSKI